MCREVFQSLVVDLLSLRDLDSGGIGSSRSLITGMNGYVVCNGTQKCKVFGSWNDGTQMTIRPLPISDGTDIALL
jgi:hypothetical protein